MIGKLKGILTDIHGNEALIETSSGVSYRVYVTPGCLALGSDGALVEVYTYLNVREDELTLFGFETHEMYLLFTHFVAIDGVGPKTAFLIVSTSHAGDIRTAVVANDVAYFQRIKGIGKKTAQRILIDLAGRFGGEFDITAGHETQDDQDALSALQSLGFTAKDARKTLSDIDPTLPLDQRITQALQTISRR